jgi:hypothetical protein
MVKDRITALLLTIIILYFALRAFAVIYGVVKILNNSEFIPIDTTYHNYPELDRAHLRSQLKYYENNKIKTDSTRSK